MPRKILFVIGALGVLVFGFFASGFFLPVKGYFAAAAASVLRMPVDFLANFRDAGARSQEFERLALENAKLKAELLYFMNASRVETQNNREYRVSKIYSTYPFNTRGLIAVNAGSRDGIAVGMAVTVDGFTFLGQVEKTEASQSLVRTIFDPGWQVPVKIGSHSVDALLVGGREPHLTLIVKSGAFAEGDPIYVGSRDFPYGLKIGEVRNIKGDGGSAFFESDIALPYEPARLNEVWILVQ